MTHLFALLSLFIGINSFAGDYLYVTNPDPFASKNITHYIAGLSDTGRYNINSCYRSINRPDYVQIVCSGSIEMLMHGGYPVKAPVSCLHNFKLNSANGKYLTTREPICNR